MINSNMVTFQKNPHNFLKELKVIHDVITNHIKIPSFMSRNTNKSNFLFPNSFIFKDQLGNYKIENSIAFLINEVELKDPLSIHIKKIFTSYYNKCPDYSNYFYLYLYEFLVKVTAAY